MIARVLRCALEVEGSPYHVLASSGDQPSTQRMLVVGGLPCGKTMVTWRPGGTPAGYGILSSSASWVSGGRLHAGTLLQRKEREKIMLLSSPHGEYSLSHFRNKAHYIMTGR